MVATYGMLSTIADSAADPHSNKGDPPPAGAHADPERIRRSGFAGRLVHRAATVLNTTLEIVRKPADQRGFAVHPRRWVVERTLSWLTAHRRSARDYERHPETSEAMIRWAGINQMLRRLTRGHQPAAGNAAPSTRPTDTYVKHLLSMPGVII
jgi:hypothetical protein